MLAWQGVPGGVESGETPEQAARRETFEEAGVAECLPLYRLDVQSALSANIFHAAEDWGRDVLVAPMHFFAMPCSGEARISEGHMEMRWLKYALAYSLIYWHNQRLALLELDERLIRNNLIR